MLWISTRDASHRVSFRDALFAGLAPDGGLYTPARLDRVAPSTLESLAGQPLTAVAVEVAAHFIGDGLAGGGQLAASSISRRELAALIDAALDFPIPLVPIGTSGVTALEAFHGPTFAFKDVGARVMARLMAHFRRPNETLTVLVATSGDTGGAVAHAFAGVDGTRVVILYPHGQVSDVQEAQLTTLGGNVHAVAVDGTFDDCQAMVKAAFGNAPLREAAGLTSANSINAGRLLPQIFYYAWGALQQPDALWSVPSGNFGNLTAGLLAKRIGFPIHRFVAATNVNDVVPEYLVTGRYAARPSVRTVANAMDVGAPSNFERIRTLYDNDLDRLRGDVSGAAFDDAQVLAAIADVDARFSYVLDPHSAIAWLGLIGEPFRAANNTQSRILVATAHPAKFREIVEPQTKRTIELPQPLKDALEQPRMITHLAADDRKLAEVLR
jgi:threonine synthase